MRLSIILAAEVLHQRLSDSVSQRGVCREKRKEPEGPTLFSGNTLAVDISKGLLTRARTEGEEEKQLAHQMADKGGATIGIKVVG